MEYRVEELARAAGISVDTIRFYQSKRLLPPPRRDGRVVLYSAEHLERIHEIRALNRLGLTLDAVRRALETPGGDVRTSLLGAMNEAEGDCTYTRAELADVAEIPEALLEQAEQAGLLNPVSVDGERRFTDADRRAARSAMALLDAGIPLHELLPLAVAHHHETRSTVDRAVELFHRYVREADADGRKRSTEEVTRAFRELLPAVTTLVALHFQRSLIDSARERLADSEEAAEIEAALAATGSARLRVSWG